MEAPRSRIRSKLPRVTFEQQPPRLVRWGFHASPLDFLMIGLTENGALCRLSFARGRAAEVIMEEWRESWPRAQFTEDKKATAKAMAVIVGKSRAGLALQMTGTKFQHAVWKELIRVPRGSTISYGELARRIKMPKAMRAVGNAMGANPIPLLVPCHRVIATGGGIGGFGSGLDLKRRLLAAEECRDVA
ncbi:MAG: methylated-DNA--[protein]-cysteine S-methyltransferase [Bdellovibrionales bacterium]